MTRTGLVAATAVLTSAFFAPPPFQGGDLARRIASAPDGLVKMTYASRDGICGDGRSFIADATSGSPGYDVWFMDGLSLSGSNTDFAARCSHGPVRLLIVVRDHRVIDVQPFVGPPSAASDRPGTELGAVSVAAVSRYLLDLAAHGGENSARNAIMAASIADSVRIAGSLSTMARDKSLATSVRETAIKWTSRIARREGDRDALQVPRKIAEDQDDQIDVRERAIRVIGEDDDGAIYLRSLYTRLDNATLRERVVRVVGEHGAKPDMEWVRGIALDRAERTSIREQAVKVIGDASDSRGLRDLYDRLEEPALRERVIRTMSDIGDGESKRWLREIAERRTESSSVRERAIRSLAEAGDLSYLRSAYRTLDDENLRERIIKSVADGGGSETMTWLRGIVSDSKESGSLRERAVRSMAEGGVTTADLVTLYDSVPDRTVRDRLVSILAERGDRAARDKLRSIATGDPDEDLRRRATKKLTDGR